ncbi:hypothetical protein R5R35_012008 [Gryllus longicercus]|uniref:RRM domain-containing protein n=1 Tax=Gryllus longicercus TaxID=2509291 RepID=A0AAN9W7E9_9ORTH
MAKICNSRSKVYETRGVVEDEPVEHIESEGERLIKQMVQKQLDPHVNLGQELKREQNFKSVQETLPLTAYVRGETTLKEFEQTTEKVAHIEELKSFGLSNDEIQLLLDYKRDILAEKYKKTDRSILSSQIESILKKIECAKTESNYSLEQSSSLTNNRHERELGLCVKPESVHTKLLKFVLSCQKTKTDARPPDHPINNLKNIEKELFGHVAGAKKKKKSGVNKYAKLSPGSNETVFQRFSYENGNSLWDVTKVKTCTRRKSPETSSHVYTCKPECLYTVKKGEIIPIDKRNAVEKKDKIESNIFKCNDEFVVSDMRESTIPLVPLEDISKNCLSIQEIKSISKFANYVEGTPSKVLYVKNLAGSVINDDLVSLFGHFESDSGTRIMYRLLTGRMRGQAFVTFPSS